jgi:hypothetical protein
LGRRLIFLLTGMSRVRSPSVERPSSDARDRIGRLIDVVADRLTC